MTVMENLEMGAFTQNSISSADLEAIFARFPRLKERRKQVAGTLSGGEQQMLSMGRALMSKPKLMMLDEPSMGLAPILVEQVFEIIAELNKAARRSCSWNRTPAWRSTSPTGRTSSKRAASRSRAPARNSPAATRSKRRTWAAEPVFSKRLKTANE
jgi:hypothetical protein